MSKKRTVKEELLFALEKAWEHLEYCGYGDKWERECAEEDKIQEIIKGAIVRAKEEKN